MTIFLVINETHGFTRCLHDLAISPTLRYIPGNCRVVCFSPARVETVKIQAILVDRKHRVYKVSLLLLISLCFFLFFSLSISMISVSFLPSLLSRLNSFFFYSFRILYIFQCMFYCISIGIAIFPELSILVSMEIQQRERKRRTEKKD